MKNKKYNKAQNGTSLISGSIDNQVELFDELGRKPFAEGVTSLIKTYKGDECFVIGIEGAWGEGKSYTIELIKRNIIASNCQLDTNEKPIGYFEFNPWHFSDGEHLAELFLRELAIFVHPPKVDKYPEWFVSIVNKLRPVEKFITQLLDDPFLLKISLIGTAGFIGFLTLFFKLMPVVGALGGGTTLACLYLIIKYLLSQKAFDESQKNLKAISKLLNTYAHMREDYEYVANSKTLQQLKDDIGTKIQKDDFSYSRIVVAIEDLDRLTPAEVRDMVQLMRMVADFPKIIYLVGYDRNQVVRALGEMAGAKASREESVAFGEGYIQKVVQAAYQLPRPPDFAVAELIFNRFYKMVQGTYGDEFYKMPYWKNTAHLIGQLWATVRDGERVINRALLMVIMLKEKSNPVDILVSAYFMEFQKNLWLWIWKNQDQILGGGVHLLKGDSHQSLALRSHEPPQHGYLQDNIDGDQSTVATITTLMQRVFPSLASSYPHDFNAGDRKICRIGNRDFLESYFRFEAGAIAQVHDMLPKILEAKGKDRERLLETLKAGGDDMFFSFIKELKEYNETKLLAWQTEALPLLADLGRVFDDVPQSEGVFKVAPADRIFWLAIDWINQQPEKKRVRAFQGLVSKWIRENIKYLPLRLIEKAGQEGGWIPYDGITPSDKPFNFELSPEEQTALKEQIERQLDFWARNNEANKWLEHAHAAAMFFQWLRLNPEKARKTLDEWISEDWKLFSLLKTMMNTSYTHTEQEGTIAHYGLAKYGLKKLVNMDKADLEKRVHEAAQKNPHAQAEYAEVIEAVDHLPEELPD